MMLTSDPFQLAAGADQPAFEEVGRGWLARPPRRRQPPPAAEANGQLLCVEVPMEEDDAQFLCVEVDEEQPPPLCVGSPPLSCGPEPIQALREASAREAS